jgi:integrating conjugative element protein (TIGR03761 family)
MTDTTVQPIKPDGATSKAPRKSKPSAKAIIENGANAGTRSGATTKSPAKAVLVDGSKMQPRPIAKAPLLAMMPESITRPVAAPFPTSPKSPFPDKYDIDSERISLADMNEMDDFGVNDIRWPRYAELCDREDELLRMKANSRHRDYADKFVGDAEAKRFSTLGKLVSSEREVMVLHTRDSYRLFMGREKGDSGFGAVSGKRIAAALRAVWLLSGNDNPYADWALLQTSDRIHDLRASLEKAGTGRFSTLQALKNRGLNYSVLRSENPAEVELGFQSPYGYMLAEMIVDIDHYARVIKTLVNKDKMTQKEGYTALYRDAIQPARSIFESLLPIQRMLQREHMLPLSRADWTGANDLAKKRVQFALECFGECPRDIFTGERAPRHSKRKGEPSKDELSFLQNVPLDGHSAARAIDLVAAEALL